MKKTVCILLTVLAVLFTFVAAAERKTSASAQTTIEETAALELCMDAQADTLGGSTGGAPVLEPDELAAFIFDAE